MGFSTFTKSKVFSLLAMTSMAVPALAQLLHLSDAKLLTLIFSVVGILFVVLNLLSVSSIHRMFAESYHVIGAFIRGDFNKRVSTDDSLDEVSRLQHRLNNLLDIVDVAARKTDAMVDAETDGDYYEKVITSPLIKTLSPEFGEGEQDTEDGDATHLQLVESSQPGTNAGDLVLVRAMMQDIKQSANQLQELTRRFVESVDNNPTGDAVADHSAIRGAASSARQAVSMVQQVAAQLTDLIGEISGRVKDSGRIAEQAVENARKTNGIVQGLSEASNKIGDVVKLITDIAGQTNLLALNATIEAARAGEAGRGFAVVASEVKNLADQTAQATHDIVEQITNIQESTSSAVSAIQEISQTIDQISEISGAINASVEQQTAATEDINTHLSQAADGASAVTSAVEAMENQPAGSGVPEDAVQAAHDALQAVNTLLENTAVLDSHIDEAA